MADRSSTYTLEFAGGFAAGANTATTAAEKLAAQLVALKAAATGVKDEFKGLKPATAGVGKGLEEVGKGGKKAGEASFGLDQLTGALKATDGAGAGFVGRAGEMYKAFGKLLASPVGVAAAVVVLTIAVIGAAAAFAHWALSSADLIRQQQLLAQAATGSEAAGAALTYQIDNLGGRTGLTGEALRTMGLDIARAGIAGKQLATVFNLTAIAASTMGDAAASQLRGIAEEAIKAKRFSLNALQLRGSGVGLDDVAAALAMKFHTSLGRAKAALQTGGVKLQDGIDALDAAVNNKLGKIAQAQALGLDVQLARLKDNVTKLFSGLNIDPFLEGLKDLFSLFDQNTVSGKGLSAAMKGIATPLIEGFALLMPLSKTFFQGMIIAALNVAIVMLKVRNFIRETFAGSKGAIEDNTAALVAGKVALYGIAIVAGIVAIAMALAAAATVLFLLVFVGPIALIIYGLYKLVEVIIDVFGSVKGYLSGLDFGAIATGLIRGLVDGIKGGAGWVIDAITGLGSGAMAAFKRVLGIKSPSTVFKAYGMFTAQGFAEGVDEGAPAANRSVASMVQTPDDVRGSSSSSSRTITIGSITISGVKDAEQLRGTSFFQELVTEIERAVVGAGGVLPEPGGA